MPRGSEHPVTGVCTNVGRRFTIHGGNRKERPLSPTFHCLSLLQDLSPQPPLLYSPGDQRALPANSAKFLIEWMLGDMCGVDV